MFNFGFSFFVTIVFIMVSIANNANSTPTPTNTKNRWPADLHLDESNWKNSCNLTIIHNNGHNMDLSESLRKVQMTVDALEGSFNSGRRTLLNIHNDTSNLERLYSTMPKFNKTLPVKKLLRDIHKSVQIYVGMFEALSSQFSVIDSLKQNSPKEISTELRYFLNESKLLLCEIETALNVSRQAPQHLSRAEMQQKIVKMTRHLNSISRLIELDAFYAKKFFYEFVANLAKYLKVVENKKLRANRNGGAKKSLNSKENKRKLKKKNNRKLANDLNNNSNGSESSAVTPQKRHRKPTASSEKKPKRINNKTKLNNSNNSSSSRNGNLSKKNRSQEGSKPMNRHRHAKSTPSPAASI